MRIIDLIPNDMVIANLGATTKKGVLTEIADHLARRYSGLTASEVARVLLEREDLASTAIGEGVAIPHGKMSALPSIVACLARAKDGIEFGSMDGNPTYLFFVMVAPENSTGAHLKALARISRVFKDSQFRKRLLDADGQANMYDVLKQEDAKY